MPYESFLDDKNPARPDLCGLVLVVNQLIMASSYFHNDIKG